MKNKVAFERALGGHHAPVIWKRLANGRPASVRVLCHLIRPDLAEATHRAQQQRVGAVVASLNSLLERHGTGHVIAPGRPRGTYQLFRRS